MPTEAGKPKQALTPEERVQLAEKQLAEALQQLEQLRQRADLMEAKLQELKIPLDFLSMTPPKVDNITNGRDRQNSSGDPSKILKIYTDGACSGNPGPGGWGTVVYFADGSVHELGGGERQTTNNRMEMQAAIAALEFLAESGQTEAIALYTDSEYVKNGISQWIHGWKKKGWKTAAGKPVLNQDLWQRLDALNSKQVQWRYVRGHSGDEGNERCDEIARAFSVGRTPTLRKNS